jgi:hypothetical protein
MKNVTIKALPNESKISKKEMFESVYTAILTKVNGSIGSHGGFKVKELYANESQPCDDYVNNRGVEFEIQELGATKAEVPMVNEKDKEIERKVTEYNKKLVSEGLLKVLTEEREKEEEREQLYVKTKDPIEKKRLEKILAFERARSSERINKINEEINIKLEQYEKRLRTSS